MKDYHNEDEVIALISYVRKSDKQIINSGYSCHMTGDESKFETFENYNGNSAIFWNVAPCLVKGKGSIRLTKKITYDNAYLVEGLNYNLLSVLQLNSSGCKVNFIIRKKRSMMLIANSLELVIRQ